jgi:uncharacterized protein
MAFQLPIAAESAADGCPADSRAGRLMPAMIIVAALVSTSARADAASSPSATDSAWYDQSAPIHSVVAPVGIERTSSYISMRDGTKLAISAYLPQVRPAGTTLPTLLHQTRYWRESLPYDPKQDLTPAHIARLLGRGYAYVAVDVRGTGASYGKRRSEYSREEMRDSAEIADWIVAQPWSNGKIAVEGVSYSGFTAEFSLISRHPAIVAAVPSFSMFDSYDEAVAPGGVRLMGLLKRWGTFVHQLDRNCIRCVSFSPAQLYQRGVTPVDADDDQSLLGAAISSRAGSFRIDDFIDRLRFRDDSASDAFGEPLTVDHFSPHAYVDAIRAADAAVYGITGWYDGAVPSAVLRRHFTRRGRFDRVLIGPWDHGLRQNISPWSPNRAPAFDKWAEILRFLDFRLKALGTQLAEEPPIHYFTMGEERWKSTRVWPPKEMRPLRYHFAEGNRLTTSPSSPGVDKYTVDFGTTTGLDNRWASYANLQGVEVNPIAYSNRNAQQERLLTYTSAPLTDDLEVTGNAIVTLHVRTSAEDAAFHVYLEDVTPRGDVIHVTEGILRGGNRRSSQPPYDNLGGPYHSHKRSDYLPLNTEDTALLEVQLIATSYLFRSGHSLRIGIAGADAHFFEQIPAIGPPPVIEVLRDAAHPSHVDLPAQQLRKTRTVGN